MRRPHYYEVLDVPQTATAAEIRTAYMREALKWHPDRSTHPGAQARFQEIANAFETLSDEGRRQRYDAQFAGRDGGAGSSGGKREPAADADATFSSVFDDMLASELGPDGAAAPRGGGMWQALGWIAGGVLGFIVANFPGAIGGAWVGGKLGGIRDKTGKPVAVVFNNLSHADKARVLASLVVKFGL